MAYSLPFTITDDKGNTIAGGTRHDRNSAVPANAVVHGNSNKLDVNGKRYPQGFTPPEDFIVNDPQREFGVILTPTGTLYKTTLNGIPNIDAMSQKANYVDGTNVDPTTGAPMEAGIIVDPNVGNTQNYKTTQEKIEIDKKINENSDARNETNTNSFTGADTNRFKYGLNRDFPELITQDPNGLGNFQRGYASDTHYLGSFLHTFDANEDPTILGFDLSINVITSPLFNGAIPEYLDKYSKYSELKSRKETYDLFIKQFFKVFKADFPDGVSGANSDPKTHYIKKISGLNYLLDVDMPDKTKIFAEYPNNMIKMSMYEDVDLSMGYLYALYKKLTWSKLNGKKMIPDNLLKFNLELTVTEVRHFSKIYGTGNDMNVMKDLMSKHIYNLYECQLYFGDMPFGDEVDNTSKETMDGYDISFNHKFSGHTFIRFDYDWLMANYTKNVTSNQFYSTGSQFFDKRYATEPGMQNLDSISTDGKLDPLVYTRYTNNNTTTNLVQPNQGSSINQLKQSTNSRITNPVLNSSTPLSMNSKSKFRKVVQSAGTRLAKDLVNAGIKEVNRQISIKTRMLNQALDSFRNSAGLGQINEPTNVYQGTSLFENDVRNAGRAFLGNSLRGLF
jgi:hypothetical protein